jgi:alpha-ribazole phosphatase
MEIYLIRHTTPKIDKGICYGQSEIQLADSFNSELETMRSILPKTFDVLYSSPSMRCFQLAALLRAKKKFGDDRLLEMDFGDWEMKAWDTIDKNILDVWMKNYVTMRVPNGESFMDLHNRVCGFFHELLQKNYQRVALVTHAGVIRCIVTKLLKMSFTDAFTIKVDYASVKKIKLSADGSLETVLV